MNRGFLRAMLASLALAMGGCGGGDGGGGGGGGGGTLDDGVFIGSYTVAQLSALRSLAMPANEDADAAWGRAVADGAGTVTPTLATSDKGAVTPPMLQPPTPYSVAADGSLSLPNTVGGIATDGVAAVLMDNAPGSDPNMVFALRTSGVYDDSKFNGNYHFGILLALPLNYNALWSTTAQGPVVADGMGGVTYPALTRNTGGVISTPTPGTFAYSVAMDGTLTTTFAGDEGGLLPDGSFAVLGGSTNGSADPNLSVYIKYSVAATNSLFSGAYWAVGMSSDPSSNSDWTSFVGTVTADGAGGMDYAPTTENHEGAVTMPNHSDTFVIAANGALTTSGGSRVGAITSDGKYAYLCGEGGAGAPCTLFLFVHK